MVFCMVKNQLTLIIAGPTAVGKTGLAVQIARKWQTPIVSADARQCYKYLDIGTAKPPLSILDEIPHYHVSRLTPDQHYSAAQFAEDIPCWKKKIDQKNKPLLITGGSTLYLDALLRPFDPIPPRNTDNIKELKEIDEKSGIKALYQRLEKIDPEYTRRMDGYNKHRIYRALDVWMQTGKPFSSFHSNRPYRLPEKTILVTLGRNRDELHLRINQRVDDMISSGLVEEVKNVLNKGYPPTLPSLRTIGYREVIDFLKGDSEHERMREKIKINTRRYARRQMTWFRRWEFAYHLNLTGVSSQKAIETIFKWCKKSGS